MRTESTQHPLDAITGSNAIQLNKERSTPSGSNHADDLDQADIADRESGPANNSVRSMAPAPHALNLSGLKSPAIILDNAMRLIWQNKLAVDLVWHRSRTANNGNPTPDIFDLLFDQQFQLAVDNWRQWVSFFTQQVMEFIPAEALQDHIQQMSPRQRDVISVIVTQQSAVHVNRYPSHGYLRQVLKKGDIHSFNVTVIDFNEGRLMVFAPVAELESCTAKLHSGDEIQRRYNVVRRQPNPIKVGLCALSACLNNAIAFKTELLSDEYCRLLQDLCRMCIETIEQFGGCFQKHSDSGLSAYFLPLHEHDEDTAIYAIRCALALKAKMSDLGRIWKLRKSWLHDIDLNIGIHYNVEHVGILRSALGDSLAGFGHAMNTAIGLSHMAQNGQIWVTKALVNGMLESARTQLRFGIHRLGNHRPQVLIQNSFAKLRDLPGSGDLTAEFREELEGVAVTQIFDLKEAD